MYYYMTSELQPQLRKANKAMHLHAHVETEVATKRLLTSPSSTLQSLAGQ